MKSTPHLIIAVVGTLIALAITLGPLLDGGGAIAITTTELKITPKKGDTTIIPHDAPIKPLVDDLAGPPATNPFTGKSVGPPPSRLPPPPPPPLELPLPPILPLPEK
jgi:hypothetical protein